MGGLHRPGQSTGGSHGQAAVGFLNPALYAIGKGASYTSDFHDTTTGNNYWPSSPTKFSAVTGYDLAPAGAHPAGSNLINALLGTATVTLGNLNPVYDGTGKSVSVTTTPPGLTVNLTYNGSASAPTNAGSYTVIGTINDPNYAGSATNTLVISEVHRDRDVGQSQPGLRRHRQECFCHNGASGFDGESDLQRQRQCADQRGQLHGHCNDQ